MASAADEELAASKTDGFKVGEKKTVEEYAKLGKLVGSHIHTVVHYVTCVRGNCRLAHLPSSPCYIQKIALVCAT